MEIKFNIGDKVMQKRDDSEQVREVLSVHIKEEGVFYTVTSRDVDIKARDVVNGTMYLEEKDLLSVEEYKEAKQSEEK